MNINGCIHFELREKCNKKKSFQMSTEQILYQLKMDFVGGGVQNVVQMSN